MFHVELRQFPHVARIFNLTREELEHRILTAWAAGQVVECEDRRWAPERARLQIYEGSRLRPDEIGMGRGWANASRTGAEVTAAVLEEAQDALRLKADPDQGDLRELKQEIVVRCAAGPVEVHQAVSLAGDRHPSWRASDRLALAERSVWELLHEGRVRMLRRLRAPPEGACAPVAPTPDALPPIAAERCQPMACEEWEAVLLAWRTWAGPDAGALILAAQPPAHPTTAGPDQPPPADPTTAGPDR
ncbi:MAG: hypothetical protein ACR2LV_00515 [Solirubrobacteraceae bacterium]